MAVKVYKHRAQYVATIIKHSIEGIKSDPQLYQQIQDQLEQVGLDPDSLDKIDPSDIEDWVSFVDKLKGKAREVLQLLEQLEIIDQEQIANEIREEYTKKRLAKKVDFKNQWEVQKQGQADTVAVSIDRQTGEEIEKIQESIDQMEVALNARGLPQSERNMLRNLQQRSKEKIEEIKKQKLQEFEAAQRIKLEIEKREKILEQRKELEEKRQRYKERKARRSGQLQLERFHQRQLAKRKIKAEKDRILAELQNAQITGRQPEQLPVHPSKRSKKAGSTVLTSASGAVFREGTLPTVNHSQLIAGSRVDEKKLKSAKKKPLIDDTTNTINQNRVHLEATRQATQEWIQQETYKDAVAQIVRAKLSQVDRHPTSGDSRMYYEIGQRVAQKMYPKVREVYNDAINAGQGMKAAQLEASKYIQAEIITSEDARSEIKETVVEVMMERQIPETEIEQRANNYIDQVHDGIISAPQTIVEEIEFRRSRTARVFGIEPLIIQTKTAHLSADESRIEYDRTKFEIGPSPSGAARTIQREGWRIKESTQEAFNTIDRLLGLDRHPSQFYTKQKLQQARLNFAVGALDEAYSWHADPIKERILLFPRLAFHTLTPTPIKKRLFNLQDKVRGKEFRTRFKEPYMQTPQWFLQKAKGATLESLSNLSGMVTYDPKGRTLLPGPLSWLAQGYSFTIEGFGHALRRRNRQQQLMGTGHTYGSILTRHASNRLLDPRKPKGPLIIFAGLIGSAITAAGEWVLQKLGVIPQVRVFVETMQGMSDAWRYGTGWCNQNYSQTLIEKLPEYEDFILKWQNQIDVPTRFIGRKFLSPLSSAYEVGKIGLGSGLKGTILGLGIVFVSANPTLAVTLGSLYFTGNTIEKFIKSPKFGGEWLLDDMGQPIYQAGRLGNPTSQYHFITRIAHKFGFPLEDFVKAVNAPFDNFRLITELTRGQKALAGFMKMFPTDGFMISLALFTSGLPVGTYMLLPVGADLLVRSVNALLELEKLKAVVAGWNVVLSGVSLAGDFILSSYSLSLVGGIPGLLSIEGWPAKKLVGLILEPLGMFASASSFTFAIGTFLTTAGIFTANPITVGIALGVGAAVTVGYYATDTILRILTGKGIWESFLQNWVTSTWNYLTQGSSALATRWIGGFISLLSFVSSFLRGDFQGMTISLAMFLATLGITATSFVILTGIFPQSYYTPVESYEVVQNAFINGAKKSFDNNRFKLDEEGNTLYYNYSYNINDTFTVDGENIEVSSLTISEIDSFSIEGEASPYVLFTDARVEDSSIFRQNLDNTKFQIQFTGDENHTQNEYIERSFRIELIERFDTLMSNENDQLCNTITIKIEEILDTSGNPVNHNEPDIKRKICINNQGQSVGSAFTVLPISSELGTFTSCYGPRYDGYHQGVDISAVSGTQVHAVGDGRVVFVEREELEEGFGNFIKISHNDEFYTIYAHLLRNSILVEEGDTISAGDVIARVGNTGNSSGPHLHFSIFMNTQEGEKSYNPCLEPILNICSAYKRYIAECNIYNNLSKEEFELPEYIDL